MKHAVKFGFVPTNGNNDFPRQRLLQGRTTHVTNIQLALTIGGGPQADPVGPCPLFVGKIWLII